MTKTEVIILVLIVSVVFLFLVSMAGCATTITTSRTLTSGEKCTSKVSGLMFTFGMPDVCKPEDQLPQ